MIQIKEMKSFLIENPFLIEHDYFAVREVSSLLQRPNNKKLIITEEGLSGIDRFLNSFTTNIDSFTDYMIEKIYNQVKTNDLEYIKEKKLEYENDLVNDYHAFNPSKELEIIEFPNASLTDYFYIRINRENYHLLNLDEEEYCYCNIPGIKSVVDNHFRNSYFRFEKERVKQRMKWVLSTAFPFPNHTIDIWQYNFCRKNQWTPHHRSFTPVIFSWDFVSGSITEKEFLKKEYNSSLAHLVVYHKKNMSKY